MAITLPTRMSEELKTKVEQLSPFQRKYLEYRAKGLRQWEAAQKSGSEASDKEALGRVGYNIEQMHGAKEYVNWLIEQRAKNAVIDDIEIIDKLRKNYDEAINLGKIADANKAVELMGLMIGVFGKNQEKPNSNQNGNKQIKNDLTAFKNEDDNQGDLEEVDNKENRLKKIQETIKSLQIVKS